MRLNGGHLYRKSSILLLKTGHGKRFGAQISLQDTKSLSAKWVFKVKANDMRKSRLVIKGYRQKEGIDYYETFAAVSRMDSVRSIVASSVLKGWKLHQFDAVTAFLHGDADTYPMPEIEIVKVSGP
jgi:hypothetical protein